VVSVRRTSKITRRAKSYAVAERCRSRSGASIATYKVTIYQNFHQGLCLISDSLETSDMLGM